MEPKLTISEAANFLDITRQGVHRKLRAKNLTLSKEKRTYFLNHFTAKELFEINFKPLIIAMQIVKGGTGKTTLVQSIATRAALYGARVLCIDIDQQANLTLSFDRSEEAKKTPVMVDLIDEGLDIKTAILPIFPGLDLLPSRMDNASLDNCLLLKKCRLDKVYKKLISKIRKDYDLIIFDCPPSIGQSVSAASLCSDYIIAPVTPSEFSLSGLDVSLTEIKSIEESFESKIDFKILMNMYDSRKRASFDTLEKLVGIKKYKDKIFPVYIRVNQGFENVIKDKKTIFETLKWTTEKEDIDLVTRYILGLNQN